MGLGDDAIAILEDELLKDPYVGDVIQGTGGARKMRIQLNGHGKSGGGRVIYLDVLKREDLYLLFAYPKSVQENLTPEQTKIVRQLVEDIKGGYFLCLVLKLYLHYLWIKLNAILRMLISFPASLMDCKKLVTTRTEIHTVRLLSANGSCLM